MITNEQIERARENWLRASKEIGFIIITPYMLDINSIEKNVFALLPEYGSYNGTIIQLTSPPEFEVDKELMKWLRVNKYFCSYVNIEGCLSYSIDFFKNALEDWTKVEIH